MTEKTTKGQLKRIAGVKSDRALAKWITDVTGQSITQQSVSEWGSDRSAIPEARHWQFKALRLEGRI